MIVHVFVKENEISEIAFASPFFWRMERKFWKLHMIDHVFGDEKEIQKLHMIAHIFGEEKEMCI